MGPGGIGTESLDGDSRNEDWKISNTHKLIGELGGYTFTGFASAADLKTVIGAWGSWMNSGFGGNESWTPWLLSLGVWNAVRAIVIDFN